MAALAVSRFVTSTTKLIGVPTYLISTTYARQSFSRGLAAQCRPAADVRPPIRILVAIHTGWATLWTLVSRQRCPRQRVSNVLERQSMLTWRAVGMRG